MKSVWVIVSLLGVVLCASGCIGYVSGDLRNTRSDFQLPVCTNSPAPFQIIYKSDARDDYANQNIAGCISGYTFGLVPTYWNTTVHSQATILYDGTPLFTESYESCVQKFYGILWALLLPSKGINTLHSDEGGGIRVEWGIRDRTLAKVISDYGGQTNRYCVLEETK